PRSTVMRNRCFALVLASLIFCAATASAQNDLAVTYQINAHHTGTILTPNLLPPLKVKWSIDMGATIGYPLIAEGKVFVIAGPDSAGKVNLYGLDAASGNTLWGPVLI